MSCIDDKIDRLELAIQNCETVDYPLKHTFVPGLYIREIFMPKNSIVTSMIHNTIHPFFIMKGKVSVYSDNDGEQLLEAGYNGITTPTTRRVLFTHEDTVWITCHPTDVVPEDQSEDGILRAVEKVYDAIIEKRPNPLLGGVIRNNVIIKEVVYED